MYIFYSLCSTMGAYTLYNRPWFNTLTELESFETIFNIIVNSDALQNDNAQFMLEPPEMTLPLHELCQAELHMLMWYIKYSKEEFLPQKWYFLFFINDARTCYECSNDVPDFHVSSQTYDNEDVEELKLELFNINNYCVKCKRALFDIFDMTDEYCNIFENIKKIKNKYLSK
uniref:Uncharacterized protein n=1 Tax=Cryptophlebia leucotreta granulosis virus TaxID=35254 RepID=A0A2H4ZKE8_GVCL|nr:hypothetical protein [Cryptophlebia leucotreta granulovirus]